MSITEQIHEAEAEYRHMQAIEHQRKAAEAAYVLARLYQEAGDTEMSKQYARQSIALFTQAGGTDTLEVLHHVIRAWRVSNCQILSMKGSFDRHSTSNDFPTANTISTRVHRLAHRCTPVGIV
jgi:acetylornithine/succinyldiaminopimelate/putrescine aminotransferase